MLFSKIPLPLTLILLLPLSAYAGVVYVDARTGHDHNDGAEATPFRTITAALPSLTAGDTLIVRPGRYYVRPLEVEVPSTPDNPVTLRAEPRGGATLSAAWPEAAEGQVTWTPVGDGIYRTTRETAEFSTMGGWAGHFLYPYKTLTELQRAQATSRRQQIVPGPTWGFAVEDLGRTYYLRLPEGQDPNGEPIVFASAWDDRPWIWDWEWMPIVEVKNSPGLVIDGFKLEGNPVGIRFDEASHQTVVRNCLFEYVRDATCLSFNSTVEWSELTFPGFREMFDRMSAQVNGDRERPHNFIFDLIKGQPIEGGIAFSNPAIEGEVTGATLRYNFIHDVFDGDKLGRFSDSSSHHSVYIDCWDNAIEVEHGYAGQIVRNLHVHHSLFRGKFYGVVSHQQQNPRATIQGPHYVYRNVIINEGEGTWTPWVVSKTHLPDDLQGIYYYHNLIWVSDARAYLYWIRNDETVKNLAQLHYVNNILLFPDWVTEKETEAKLDYNLLVAPELNAHLTGPHGVYHATMESAGLADFDLTSLDRLPTAQSVDRGLRLAGFNDDFLGAAPDIGPWETGRAPGPDWPRPARRVIQTGPIGSDDPTTLAEPLAARAAAYVIETYRPQTREPFLHGNSLVQPQGE